MQQYSLVTIDTLSRRQTLEIPRVLYKPRKAVTHTQLFDMAAAKWARNEGINSKVRFDPLDPVTIIRYGLTDIGVVLGSIRSVPKMKHGMARDISGVVELRFMKKLN